MEMQSKMAALKKGQDLCVETRTLKTTLFFVLVFYLLSCLLFTAINIL